MAAAVRKSRTYGLETRVIIWAMQLQLAALIATYVIAITAVFVVWPAVGTAPWETAPNRIVCEGSLGMWVA